MAIVAKINNSSSSEMTPKFSLMRDVVFHAQSHTKHEGNVIQKVVENRVKPHTEKTIRCAIKLPRDLNQTIHNCDLISVEYRLKVRNGIIVYLHNNALSIYRSTFKKLNNCMPVNKHNT